MMASKANPGKPRFELYGEFIRRAYAPYIRETRLIEGRDPVDFLRLQQPPGHFPDDPIPQYILQFNVGRTVQAEADVGLGLAPLPLRRGELVIAPPDTPADYHTSTSLDFVSFGLPLSFIDGATRDLDLTHFDVEPLLGYGVNDPVVRHLIQEIWKEAGTDLAQGTLFVDSALISLSARLVGLAAKGRPKPPPKSHTLSPAAFAMLCEYVDTNIDANLRMGALARLVGMPDHVFARAFKATTGMPPYQWVIERRLDRAEQFITKSRLSLAEIAYACGFSSQAHMTTLFSRRRGVTPTAFRTGLQR